jgi:hypothetical protein
MTESHAPTRSSWLRWALVALVILTGLGLLVWLAVDAVPLIQTEEGGLFR